MTTIKRIAELSGVSRMTVSNVIRGKSGISDKTRTKVQRVIRENNFQPRVLSRHTSPKCSNIIGVIIRDITNPFYSQLVAGMSEIFTQQNYRMFIYDSHGDLDEELNGLHSFADFTVGGVVLTPSDDLDRISPEEHVGPLLERDIPVVAISRIPGSGIHCLEFDDKEAGVMATEYLVKCGHRNIYHIAGPPNFPSTTDRQTGFLQCMVQYQIPFSIDKVIRSNGTSQDGYEIGLKILKNNTETPTGIFCFNDFVALGVYKAAHELGLRIPQDVSVIGCDGIEQASIMLPTLTTVALPTAAMGRRAAEIILGCIDGKQKENVSYGRFEPKLVIRESVFDLNV